MKILKKEGLLLKELSHEELNDLATEMTNIKTQRVIDFRFDQIYEYEQILTRLFENGYADPQNYRFFSVFQDAWRYEAFRTRYEGSTLTFGPATRISVDKRENNDKRVYGTNSLELEYLARRNNMNWYYGYGLSVDYGKRFSDSDFNYSPTSEITGSITVGNYVNSRTYLQLQLQSRNGNIILDQDNYYDLGFYGRAEYFISARLKYSARVNFDIFKSSYSDTDRTWISLGAEYYFF